MPRIINDIEGFPWHGRFVASGKYAGALLLYNARIVSPTTW